MDGTYVKLGSGYACLVAIVALCSRKALAFRAPNTLDAEFCVATLEVAITRYGAPLIFNADQGCQLSSEAFRGRSSATASGSAWMASIGRSIISSTNDSGSRSSRRTATVAIVGRSEARRFAFFKGEFFLEALGYETR